MGQQREVMTYRLVTRGTIEERMMQRAKSKLVMEHLVVARLGKDGRERKDSKLEQAALDDLLR
jgi:SNF2 family DNA or RNA helicase